MATFDFKLDMPSVSRHGQDALPCSCQSSRTGYPKQITLDHYFFSSTLRLHYRTSTLQSQILCAQNILPLLHHHSKISSQFSPLTHIFVAGAFKWRKENEKQLFDGYWRAWDGSSSTCWEGLIGSVHVRRSEVANKCSLSESYGNKGMNHIALITIEEV